ncbi:apolipoprotein N-acyltransferase [uncultured Paraglaciecola sp.]|uniref:apolipoprotein N-acyltransferase n=1 Tax=uncultured Paraglaciecola sp. TaxID=1765024 RepID=UPI0030DB425A|tara:strand:+ start:58920 stop:60452 length:1533 start_codon:yes stop_codon:yes gene_type:complete
MSFTFKLALSSLLGALLTLAYAPFSFWFVTFLSLTSFIYLLSQSHPNQGFKLGFAFGLGWFGAGMSWVHVSIADFGGVPLIGSLALMLLLSAYLALFPALGFKLISKYFNHTLWPIALPFIWLLIEWLRSWLFTGLPWLSLGYSQLHGPLSGWFPVIGEFGVAGLTLLISTAMAIWLSAKKWLPSTILVTVLYVSGLALNQYQWSTPTGKSANIAMVQGNIAQALRWTPEQDQPTMDKYKNMTAAHWHNDIVIWPEAAIPQLEPVAAEYLNEMDKLAAQTRTGLITGIVNYNFETREAYNNLIGLGQRHGNDANNNGPSQGHYRYFHGNRFAKHHLLPIGEFIPFEDWLRGLAPIFDLPMSSFSRGDFQQGNIEAKGYHLAPAICFEIAFPRQISANLYYNTDFIITVSNDAWFGGSHGPAQHLEIAQARAKEFGLPVLRATNNGITAFIDHHGQIQSRLPQFEAGVLGDTIKQVTGYTPYRLFGDWPIWCLSFVIFGLACFYQKRSKES